MTTEGSAWVVSVVRQWCPSWGGQEKRESDARARRQQSTVPVAPSATMLTNRLTGTTEDSGSTTTNTTSVRFHRRRTPTGRPHCRIFAHHGAPRRRRHVADLRKHTDDHPISLPPSTTG